MIPKIIHYCWLSDDDIPEKLLDCMKSWKKVLPDYDFILWNRKNFDVNGNIWTKQAFESKKYAFAADFIRLYAVYTYGGIYLDMDVEVKKDFLPFLDGKLMLGFENPEKVGIEAGCFGAEKKSAFIKKCLDYYEGRKFIKEDGTFDTEVLPKIMKSFLPENELGNVVDYDYFTAKSFLTGKIIETERTFAVHNFAGSWNTKREQTYYKTRQRLCNRLGIKTGLVLSFPSFLIWQLCDFGIKIFMQRVIKRLRVGGKFR